MYEKKMEPGYDWRIIVCEWLIAITIVLVISLVYYLLVIVWKDIIQSLRTGLGARLRSIGSYGPFTRTMKNGSISNQSIISQGLKIILSSTPSYLSSFRNSRRDILVSSCNSRVESCERDLKWMHTPGCYRKRWSECQKSYHFRDVSNILWHIKRGNTSEEKHANFIHFEEHWIIKNI